MGRGIPRIAQIQQAVARECGVDVATMRAPDNGGGSRLRKNARPRQIAMLLAYRLTSHGRSNIGRLFGNRHYSTVIHACAAVQQRCGSDPALRNVLRRVTLELVCGAAL